MTTSLSQACGNGDNGKVCGEGEGDGDEGGGNMERRTLTMEEEEWNDCGL